MEKLIGQLTVRLKEADALTIERIAESHCTTASEYVRSLIEQAIAEERRRFIALSTIFGNNTNGDKVNNE